MLTFQEIACTRCDRVNSNVLRRYRLWGFARRILLPIQHFSGEHSLGPLKEVINVHIIVSKYIFVLLFLINMSNMKLFDKNETYCTY